MKKPENNISRLVRAFTTIDNENEMKTFLSELCSPSELTAISERLKVADMLKSGNMYSDIAASMNVSSSLIAKIDDIIVRGKGGYDIGLRASKESAASYSYGSFASVYDLLTYDVDYESRVKYVTKLFKKFADINVNSVLDLACGTGTATSLLHDLGYEMIGVDSSADMLSQARQKKGDRDILYLQQDIKNFELYGTVDAVICLLDGVNYLLDEEDLLSCFKWVHNYLNPGGVFVFDVNTKHKLENILAGNIFNDERDGVFYSWENYYDSEENICEFNLNVFVRNGSSYKRINEIHYEKAYSDKKIKALLKKAGLSLMAVYDDLSFEEPVKKSEKVFYIAKKIL